MGRVWINFHKISLLKPPHLNNDSVIDGSSVITFLNNFSLRENKENCFSPTWINCILPVLYLYCILPVLYLYCILPVFVLYFTCQKFILTICDKALWVDVCGKVAEMFHFSHVKLYDYSMVIHFLWCFIRLPMHNSFFIFYTL